MVRVERKDEPLDRAAYLGLQSHLSLYIVFQASCVWPFLSAACYCSLIIITDYIWAGKVRPFHSRAAPAANCQQWCTYEGSLSRESRAVQLLASPNFNSRLIPKPCNAKWCLSSF